LLRPHNTLPLNTECNGVLPWVVLCLAHHASDLRKASIVIRVVKPRNLLWGDLF
jgi:hypothetical protein